MSSFYEERVRAADVAEAPASFAGAFLLAIVHGAVRRFGVADLGDLVLGDLPASLSAGLADRYTRAEADAAIAAAVAGLVGTAPAALDTVYELAAVLGNDPNAIATIIAALANRLRFDGAQALTVAQKTQVQANAGLVIGTNVAAFRTVTQLLADLGIQIGSWAPYPDATGATPGFGTVSQWGYYLRLLDFVLVIGGHAGARSGAQVGSGQFRLLGVPFTPSAGGALPPVTTSIHSSGIANLAGYSLIGSFQPNGTILFSRWNGSTEAVDVGWVSQAGYAITVSGFYKISGG